MKILHVELGRFLYGGARQVTYLLEGVGAHPEEHILACAEGASIASAIANPRVRVFPLPCRGDADLGFLGRLRRLIREQQPDLMHIHSRRGETLSALAAVLEHLPAVYSRRVDNPPLWLDLKFKYPRIKRIITISQGIREVLIRHGVPDSQIACVPSAVDTERYRPGNDREWLSKTFGLPGTAPVWAIVAQLIPRKGHAVLFRALPEVLRKHPGLRVLVLGKGPLEGELRRLSADLGLSENVRFEGFRTDLERVLPCLDGLVHPAWMEGLGVSLLEAAACGIPIIACRSGGMPEIVRDGVNGRLIEPGDVAGLGAALSELLDHPHRAQAFGHAGRELATSEFSIRRMVQGNLEVYRQALALP
ncbi:glycosyltransferase [Methyloterricola oryzae]|uniref:glycosyltransferase n=1 Tax=Methyloterricola oryzae TaxID=1495050 RepID=UPI0005EBA798|nr:glycosyltransferase [Methyloterricola oryzae]